MSYLRFVHPHWFVAAVPCLLVVAWYRWFKYRPVSYTYPLTAFLRHAVQQRPFPVRALLFLVRLVVLSVLVFLLGQPQVADVTSTVEGQGVATMLVLDVSGSMSYFDDLHDRRSRIEIAKEEAIRFVNKRTEDPIGLVLFGHEAVSRLPLTLDKNIIKDTLAAVQLGDIDPSGTVLAKALLVAANRLKNATTKSKVIILLTDGEPSPDDVNAEIAVEVARRLGIKVYTIGIGDEQHGGYQVHPLLGVVGAGARLNKQLLQVLAQATGGRFFEATKPYELRLIYDQIDSLEKSSYQTTVFSHYYDIFVPFVWLILGLLFLELCAATFIWLVV